MDSRNKNKLEFLPFLKVVRLLKTLSNAIKSICFNVVMMIWFAKANVFFSILMFYKHGLKH